MSTVRYYHGAEGTSNLSDLEPIAAALDEFVAKYVQPGSQFSTTFSALAPLGGGSDLAVAAINVFVDGDRNEVSIGEHVIDATATSLIAQALVIATATALGISGTPVLLLIGASVAATSIYNAFFDGDVHDWLEEQWGTTDKDVRLYDAEGNWIGGGFYRDGFEGLTEQNAVQNLVTEMVSNGSLPSSTANYFVRVYTGSSASSNTVTVYNLADSTSETYLESNIIDGTDGNDTLTSSGGKTLISGFDGNDYIQTTYALSGEARVSAGDGDDTVYADGHDTVFGDSGDDTIRLLVNGEASGGEGNDSLTSYSSSSNSNNTFYGGNGNDFIATGGGRSIAYGDAGNDTINSEGYMDTLHGGVGDDYFVLGSIYAGDGARIIDGGTGSDTVKFTGLTINPWNYTKVGINGSITVTTTGDLIVKGSWSDDGDTLTGIELLEFNNLTVATSDIIKPVITGTNNNDVLEGTAAPNEITGNDGDDELYGKAGNDTLDGGSGSDTLDGGADTDTIDYNGATSAVSINLETGIHAGDWAAGDVFTNVEIIAATNYDDTLMGSSINDVLMGRQGADSITGGNGDDALYGNSELIDNDSVDGADTIEGGFGNDTLYGNNGNDYLSGGANNDYLSGGSGDDTLTGGTDADVFMFDANWGTDVLSDFSDGEDIIDLSTTGLIYTNLTITQLGADTEITDGFNNTILLLNTLATNINQNDFAF